MADARPRERAEGRAGELDVVDGIAQLAFLVHADIDRRAGELGMSLVQARMLGVLRDRVPTMTELGAALGLDKASVSGLVQRAERRDLVARERDPGDGRATRVRLLPEGRRLVTEATAGYAAAVGSLLDAVDDDDRAALARILSRILVAEAAGRGIDLLDVAAPEG